MTPLTTSQIECTASLMRALELAASNARVAYLRGEYVVQDAAIVIESGVEGRNFRLTWSGTKEDL